MVTTQNLDWMKRNNFGIRVLSHPISSETLSAELRCYDAADARKVSEAVRSTAGLSEAVDQILSVYQCVLDEWAKDGRPDPVEDGRAFSADLKGIANDFYRVTIENNLALNQANQLQAELDDIHGRAFWKAYVSVARVAWLRRFYLWVTAPFRRR